MKIAKLFTLLLLAMVACKSGGDENVDALKEKKAKLETELAELNTKIKGIEKASGKANVEQKVVFIQSKALAPQTFRHYIEIQGKVTTVNNLTISPRTAGQITRINVKKGQNVNKGAVLASIDVSAMTKGKDELKTALNFATDLYEKQQKLWDQKIGTEMQYLQAKNNKESIESKIATLNEQLAFGTVTAPVSGVIEEVYPVEGENTAPGMPMFRLIGKGDFKISADISEAYASKVDEGNEAEVFFPDLNKSVSTNVKVVGDEISSLNRTFNIELALPKAYNGIKANTITYVKIKDYEKKGTLVIPISIIQKSLEGTFVYVDNGGKAEKKLIKTGQTYNGETEVLSGLKAGDKIVTTGYLDLMEGQPVKY